MLGSQCRAICYEHHDWPFIAGRGIFSEISGLDTRWCESIRSDMICCARMRSTRFVNFRCHDQSRSDLPFRYAHIHSDRIVVIESTIGSRSDTIITIRFPELERSDTCKYVPIRSSRTDALCYDSIRLWSRCFSWSWSRVITIWATTGLRWVYLQPDWPWTSFDFRNSVIPPFAVQRRQWLFFFLFAFSEG